MGGQESYEDRVLLKLRRTYTKDETIQALNRKLEELELEKGQLLSEIDHLTHSLKEQKSAISRELLEIVRESSLYKEQQELLKKRGVIIRKLYQEISELRK